MSDRTQPTTSGFRAREKAALAVAFVALVVIGKSVSPSKSSAATAGTAASPSAASPLGTLKGREHQVEIKALGHEVLYTVRDANGRVLANDIDASTLSRLFPTITLDKAHAHQPLMMADPDR